MGKKMAGTNEFAFFSLQKHMYRGGGGVQNQAEKKIEKMPSGRYRYKSLLFQTGGTLKRCGLQTAIQDI